MAAGIPGGINGGYFADSALPATAEDGDDAVATANEDEDEDENAVDEVRSVDVLAMARLGSIIGDASAMKPRGLTVEASACSVDACCVAS